MEFVINLKRDAQKRFIFTVVKIFFQHLSRRCRNLVPSHLKCPLYFQSYDCFKVLKRNALTEAISNVKGRRHYCGYKELYGSDAR
jgi:hypothetical protein